MARPVQTLERGRALEILLNRPDTGNAFDAELVEVLLEVLDALDPEAFDTVIFQGAGKGFCGGFDLSNLALENDASLLWRFVRIEKLLQRVAALPQQTVALAHRFAFGAGADLFVACRHRIAAPGTKFSFPGVRFGIALGTGRLAQRVGPETARQLLDATAPVQCDEAVSISLVRQVIEQEAWDLEIAMFCERRGSLNPRMSRIVAERLHPGSDEADMAALVKSAGVPGLKNRIVNYAESVAAVRKS